MQQSPFAAPPTASTSQQLGPPPVPDPSRVRQALEQKNQQLRAQMMQRNGTPNTDPNSRSPATLGGITASLNRSEDVASYLMDTASATAPLLPSGPSISPGVNSPVAPASGTVTGPPKSDDALWEAVRAVEQDSGATLMLNKHSHQLQEVFDYYAQGTGAAGGKKLIVLGAQGERRGLLRLANDYDVCPTFLTKRDVKTLYMAICKFGNFQPSQGIDQAGLVRVLGLMAVHALSKPSFQHLYPTNQSKITVMLEMWGLGAPAKLQGIRQGR